MSPPRSASSVLFAILLLGCHADTGLPGAPATPAATGQALGETVLQDATTPMTIVLDESTVRCSAADYSATFLKVLIPQIAEVTLLDHTNAGAPAPCIAAGPCTETMSPASIVDPQRATEAIELRVLRTEVTAVDHDQRTCHVSLREELFTTIRGVAFYHLRNGLDREPAYADCVAP